MALTKKQKQLAWDGWVNSKRGVEDSVYAAVEAVLAEQAGAAEQGKVCGKCESDECPSADGEVCLHTEQPTRPPAGDDNPHPSGPAHGCPYDYSNPETNRILEEERGHRVAIDGTFHCPMCGVAVPHEHTGEEIAIFRLDKKAKKQPPAGGVVERMCEAFDDAGGTGNYREAMLAALAEANKYLIPMHDKDCTIAHDCGFNAATMLAEQRMAAALKVAREGYVRLEDAEDIVSTVIMPDPARELLIKRFRNRLAKPAEQTDEAPAYKLPSTHNDPPFMKCSFCGSLVIDKVLHTKWHEALKAGKQ